MSVNSPRGQKAYEARQSGMKWIEIADEFGWTSELQAIKTAKLYAKKYGLTWPLKVPRGKANA